MRWAASSSTPLLVLGGIAVYIRDQANELERITVGGLAPAETVPLDQSLPSATTPTADEVPPIATPLNVLVVGVDRRPPGSDVEGSRADTIAVVRIDPDQQRVSMLSLPRDLWVTTDDGTSRRINSFTDNGGLVEVASSILGIDINHYVEIDFDGFESLIDLAGGVTVPFDHAVRDINTGFTADAGCNTLSGADALAYVRSRRLEQLDPATGEWRADPRSDLGRIARQQDLTQRLYTSVLAQNYSTTDKTRLLTDVVDDITVDTGLDLDGLRAIFNAAALIGTEQLRHLRPQRITQRRHDRRQRCTDRRSHRYPNTSRQPPPTAHRHAGRYTDPEPPRRHRPSHHKLLTVTTTAPILETRRTAELQAGPS